MSLLLLGGCNVCEQLDEKICADLGEEDCAYWTDEMDRAGSPSRSAPGRQKAMKKMLYGENAGVCEAGLKNYDEVFAAVEVMIETQRNLGDLPR